MTDGADCYLKKTCPEHGDFSAVIWRGSIPIENWMRCREGALLEKTVTRVQKGCPYDCGLCEEHRQHTCTALIEVTQRCNLCCRFCFADSGASKDADLSLEQIKTMYRAILSVSGTCNIQLSGGEPTVREDLPGIVKLGKELGFPFIQVNTNGIRLAQEEEFARAFMIAGLDSVFLQFDGTKDDIYRILRGRELLALKEKAIANCEKYHIGVVLVPTLVPGVNVDNIGAIIRFALDHIRAVRGVHFQPVSYFGRMPHAPADSDRVTLPEVMDELERQTGERVKAADRFYKEHLANAAVSSWEEVRTLPFTFPGQIRRDPGGFLCISPREIRRIVTLRSSGTEGEEKRIFFSHGDLYAAIDFFQYGRSSLTDETDRVLILFPGASCGVLEICWKRHWEDQA